MGEFVCGDVAPGGRVTDLAGYAKWRAQVIDWLPATKAMSCAGSQDFKKNLRPEHLAAILRGSHGFFYPLMNRDVAHDRPELGGSHPPHHE